MKQIISLLASLSMLVASFAVGHAQETALTADALQNATYGPVNPDIFGATVQLVNGHYAQAGQEGGISQRSYVFGDLNGDGADDAVVVVTELLGCCASSMNVALAAYTNDSGVPSFAATVPLGTSSDVKSVTVDSGVVTIVGLQVGANDAFCCPKQPFELHLMLQENQLVDVSEASNAPAAAAGAIQASLATSPKLNSLKGSSGPILLPPARLQPFQSLPTPRLEVGDNLVQMLGDANGVYAVFWGGERMDADAATIVGSRKAYDLTGVAQDADCDASAAYCHHPQDPNAQWGEFEVFRGLQTQGAPAVVGHATRGGGQRWGVSWFDQGTGAYYSLSVAGSDLLRSYGLPTAYSANNRAGAEKVAQLANQLVQWIPQ